MKRLYDIKSSDIKQVIWSFNKPNLVFVAVLLIYVFLAIVLFNYYQYIIVSDGLSYMSIAHEYALGDFNYAINGYWGPLYSWLLSPFLFFGSTKMLILYSAKILSLIIGFFTLIAVRFLFSKFIKDEKLLNIVILSMVPTILYFAFYLITPDLLVLCILLFYLGIIFDPKYSFRLRNGFACGFLGALAYFSKTFAFIFFILHFILFNLIFYFGKWNVENRIDIKKNLILGLTVFLALSGIWIGLISDKYDKITIGTSGTYNQAVMGPESIGHPPLYQGLMNPPNKDALSSWEDASYFEIKPWNPLGSVESFIFELNLIFKNLIKTASIFLSFSVLSFLIIVATIIFIVKNKNDETTKRRLTYLLITIFIYAGGYSLIFVEERYLWIISILLLLMGVYFLEVLYKNCIIKNKIKNLLLVILILSFIILPTYDLVDNVNVGKNFHDLSYTLKNDYNVHGNIASNKEWYTSLVLTYYLNGKYYGQTKEDINLDELETQLTEKNIDYYFVWRSNQTFLPYNEITGGKLGPLKVYSVKNRL